MNSLEEDKKPSAANDRRADAIGWTLMCILGLALIAIFADKVRHAGERQEASEAMMHVYLVQHRCVRLARPAQNQPQLIRCAEGEMTEHMLRKKVVGDSWK